VGVPAQPAFAGAPTRRVVATAYRIWTSNRGWAAAGDGPGQYLDDAVLASVEAGHRAEQGPQRVGVMLGGQRVVIGAGQREPPSSGGCRHR
jgi:hypothetical protein